MSMIVSQDIRLPNCSVCQDNRASEEQKLHAIWCGVDNKYWYCCCCEALVASVDQDYKQRWDRWYKKYCKEDKC
jgi:hypothetical protein